MAKVILFDFGGVLCKDKFYEKVSLPNHQHNFDWIQKNIFADQELINKWMRGQIRDKQINQIIATNTGIDWQLLQKLFEVSVALMELEAEMIELAQDLKKLGHKIGIVTDNMEVFQNITVPKHKLDKLFDVIISSIDHGILKQDENGRLFDMALASLNESIDNSLMIDDSVNNIQMFKNKGGQGFLYKNTADLKSFLNKEIK
jgi:HAD superfamily hydrolase (TIGR01509 family)